MNMMTLAKILIDIILSTQL